MKRGPKLTKKEILNEMSVEITEYMWTCAINKMCKDMIIFEECVKYVLTQ